MTPPSAVLPMALASPPTPTSTQEVLKVPLVFRTTIESVSVSLSVSVSESVSVSVSESLSESLSESH